MKILIFTKYTPKGPSSRYRSYNYQNWFSKHGLEVSFSPLFNDAYLRYMYQGNVFLKNIIGFWRMFLRVFELLFKVGQYDHIVIEYELFPKFSLGFEKFFLKKIKSFSLDFDDNISANYTHTANKNKFQR